MTTTTAEWCALAQAAVLRMAPDGAWLVQGRNWPKLMERCVQSALNLEMVAGEVVGGVQRWKLTTKGIYARASLEEAAQDAASPEPVRRMLISGDLIDKMLSSLGQRERATLGAMAKSGRIKSAELIAANRWFEAFAMAETGAFDADKAGGSGDPIKLFAQERQLAATTDYQGAREATGAAGDARLRAILGNGLSINALAHEIGHPAPIASGLVIGDLTRLVEHYTATDAARKRNRKR